MRIIVDDPDGQSVPQVQADGGVLDLSKERELRSLRARVGDLERKLADVLERPRASVEARDELDETHRRIGCAFHLHVVVSLTTPSVSCFECRTELSPLDVLRQYARGERRFTQEIEWLKADKRKLGVELLELRKQRSNLRSQIRRRGEKPVR